MENNARTFKEIVAYANDYLEIKDICCTSTKILNVKLQDNGDSPKMEELNATIFVRRFCSNLQMNKNDVKVVLETITNLNKLDIQRTPKSLVATTIFMITKFSRDEKSLVDIWKVTDVSEAIISLIYKEIIPIWFWQQMTSMT